MSLVKKLAEKLWWPAAITFTAGMIYGLSSVLQYDITDHNIKGAEKYVDVSFARNKANTIIESNKGFWNSIIYLGEIEAAKDYIDKYGFREVDNGAGEMQGGPGITIF